MLLSALPPCPLVPLPPIMLPLDQLIRELAAYLGTALGFEREVYSLRVPLPSNRQQEVAATIRRDEQDREIIDFVSTVGPILDTIDPWHLLQLNGQTTFSRITVARQIIFVLASQLLTTAEPEEVLLMIREVATFADHLEQRISGSDTF